LSRANISQRAVRGLFAPDFCTAYRSIFAAKILNFARLPT
jgi:hypothetical protein